MARRPSAGLILALIALVVSVGGTAFAAKQAGLISGKTIKKRSQPGNRFKKDTITGKEIKEAKLGAVQNAATLGGQPPSAFQSSAPVQRFSTTLSFGQQKTLTTAGPFTFTANCQQDATDNGGNPHSDFIQILISTSQGGAVFASDEDEKLGTSPADFLNPNTPEA